MIQFEQFFLENGLQVVVHEDHTTQMAVLNLMYNVGSKDENEKKTGFAHLFEHLMFGGSQNIESFDEPIQLVGGENNAYTSPDVTNYYINVPAVNIETAFWLESDRMLGLSFEEKTLEVQRKVVIEEFKQNYLDQPYGDVWLKLRPLVYKKHPYSWATIGKNIEHIENAEMQDVKDFFYKFYIPNNAVLVVGGNVTVEQVKELAEKWFGPIPKGTEYKRNLPKEPIQTEARTLEIEADVPLNALYKAYQMCDRMHEDYYSIDLLSDILGRGESSRLYQALVKNEQIFSSISASLIGSFETGLFLITGFLAKGVTFEEGEIALEKNLQQIKTEFVQEEELFKVKNQAESSIIFSQIELLERCSSLAYGALLGNLNLVNEESGQLQKVQKEDILKAAETVLRKENCSTLYYKSKKQ